MQVAPAAEVLRGRQQVLRITLSEEKNTEQIGNMTIENCCGEIFCTLKPGRDKVSFSLHGSRPNLSATETWLTLQYDPAAQHQISLDGVVIPVELRRSAILWKCTSTLMVPWQKYS